MRFPTLLLVLAAGILGQGCVVFPYPTPEVKGVVIDAGTQKPIARARVELHNHKYTFCETSADGAFDLHASHVWRPCFLMPGDYLVVGTFDFKAPGYETTSKKILELGDKVPTCQVELEKELKP